MTQPRMCLPGTTYLVTRTVHNRQLLLTPSPAVNESVMYCTGRAALTQGVELHWIAVQANHYHLGVTDLEGNISKFMQVLDRLIACCLIEHYRDTHPHQHLDGIWAKGQFSAVALLTPEAVFDEMPYSLTNPVKDRLVADYRKWPGVCSRPSDWARPTRCAYRPEVFFDQDDPEWASVPVRFTVPPMLRERPLGQLIADVDRLIEAEQRRWQKEHSGKGFMGVKNVLRADPFDSPSSVRPKGKTNPTVAAGGDSAMLREGIKLVRGFRESYRKAWLAYRDGNLEVVFPAGTLKMRLLHHVQCDTVDVPWCAAALAPG